MKTLQVGLAGFGPGGQVYNAPIFTSLKGYALSKIMTSNPANIAVAHNQYPQAHVVQNFEDLIGDKQIDLIVITTPNHLHYPLAKKALEAGKHVVVEKPFTTNSEEASELIALSQQKNCVVSVNHNRRWDSDIQTVKKVIESGRLGDVVEFKAHFDRFRNYIKPGWKEEKKIPASGILYDLGSHLIDQALLLFGKPSEVFCNMQTQRADTQVPDQFDLLILYPDLKVSLTAGMLVKKPGPRYTVLGRQGSFLKYGMDTQEAQLKLGKTPLDTTDWGVEPKEQWGELHLENKVELVESEPGDYRVFYENVHSAIVKGTPLIVTPIQAKTVIEVIEAAEKSHREKRIVSL